MYAADVAEHGYVWDLTRVWAHQPEAKEQLMALFASTADAAGLTPRDKAVLVIAQAAAIGDSYCAIAWGKRLSDWAGPQTAVAALAADDEPFSEREQALADWARTVARSPGTAVRKTSSVYATQGLRSPDRCPDRLRCPTHRLLQHQQHARRPPKHRHRGDSRAGVRSAIIWDGRPGDPNCRTLTRAGRFDPSNRTQAPVGSTRPDLPMAG